MKVTELSPANNKEGERQSVKKMPAIRSSIVSKIGYMLQYKELPTTLMSINDGLRIHRLNGHKFSPAQVLRTIEKIEKMAESSCQIEIPTVRQTSRFDISKGGANIRGIRDETNTKIGTSYSNMFTIAGVEESKTVLYMEKCHNFTKKECETVTYMEQCHPVTKQLYETIHCTDRCRDMTIQKVEYEKLDGENKDIVTYREQRHPVTEKVFKMIHCTEE